VKGAFFSGYEEEKEQITTVLIMEKHNFSVTRALFGKYGLARIGRRCCC
jgi:hypothetical protein